MTGERSRIDQALDVFVYAPLGLALEAKNLLPQLAERGRGQFALARLAGRFAAEKGRHEVVKLVDDIRPDSSDDHIGQDEPAERDEHGAHEPAAVTLDVDVIDDYDGLSAADVLPHLERLTKSELDHVLHYEQDHRARATVINRIRQLRA